MYNAYSSGSSARTCSLASRSPGKVPLPWLIPSPIPIRESDGSIVSPRRRYLETRTKVFGAFLSSKMRIEKNHENDEQHHHTR